MGRYKVAIIIPALNEEKTIKKVIKSASKHGKIFVVDDGSKDNTYNLSKSLGAVTIKNKLGKGYESALDAGFSEAYKQGFNIFITFDADCQHRSSDIPRLIKKYNSGYDIVVGNRNKKHRLSEFLFGKFTKIFYGIADPFSGLKLYSRAVYENAGFFDKKKSLGTDLLFYALRNNYKVCDVRINVNDRKGNSRLGNLIYSNYKIYRVIISQIIW